MFDSIKGWLCGNQNFMIIIYIVMIVIILWLLKGKFMTEGMEVRDPITGRLLNINAAAEGFGIGGASTIALTATDVDQNAMGGVQRAIKFARTPETFSAMPGAPEFWDISPELRAAQVEGFNNRGQAVGTDADLVASSGLYA